jgi:hypothetical protein
MFQTSLDIAAAAATVWRLLIDTRAWPRWGPSVRAVDAPARCIDRGMRGRVQTVAGLWLPFEITQWRDEAHWAWRVGGVTATGHGVEPLGPRRCRVTFTVPPWAPLYLPVCRVALGRLRTLALAAAVPADGREEARSDR